MSNEPSPEPAQATPLFRESLVVYGVVFLIVLALALVGQVNGFVHANLYLLVAFVFMGVPAWWMKRKALSPERFGMTTARLIRQASIGLIASVLTLAPFLAGQYIWETQVLERTFNFDVDNWYMWSLDLDGEPAQWGEEAGAWVWSEEEALHLGMRSEERQRGALIIEADEVFVPEVKGAGVVCRAVDDRGRKRTSQTPSKRWEVLPVLYGRRINAIWRETPGQAIPRSVRVHTTRVDGYNQDPLPLYFGPQRSVQEEGEGTLERHTLWILMWLVTQLFFIALPEEYFYRGYIQTRLGDAFAARKTRSWWIVSPQNLATSVLFGLGHLFIPVGGVLLPGRFAVFFPSLLFGLLRERTGSITASVVYHTCCNMMVLVWAVHYV